MKNVVIAVVVIGLASVVLAIFTRGRVLEKAYEIQARAMMVALSTAIDGYKEEYGHYPMLKSGGRNGKVSTLHDSGLVACLMGVAPADPASDDNPKRIQFFNPPSAKKDGRSGYDSATGDLLDPWRQPLWVLMDVEGKGYLENPYYGAAGYSSETQEKLALRCIVWDFGPDQIDGTKSRSTDDLRSWR